MSVLTPSAMLAPDGLLSRFLEGYESRPQQVEMARVVEEALAAGEHAVVEAPTGVGKSFAYLLPAAIHAREHDCKIVVSTGTIALQEQLVHKDLPLLEEALPGTRAVLVKGRQNYISRRRLDYALHGQRSLLDSREQVREVQLIDEWAGEHEAGDRSDLGFSPHPAVWRKVVSDTNNCLGRRCPTHERCFFYGARREIEEADILVVNHHLYFSDLALREEHGAILPAHAAVIFDEAHSIEDVATEHLGLTVSDAQIRYFLDGLGKESGGGLLAEDAFAAARAAVGEARDANREFWREVAMVALRGDEDSFRIHEPGRFPDDLSPCLDRVSGQLRGAAERAEEANLAQELRAQADRAVEFAGTLRAFCGQKLEGYVYYANVPRTRGTPSLSAHPLRVDRLLKERLFEPTRSVILTSATLAADASDRFLFLRRRLGLEEARCRRLDSPFDFARQTRLLINETPLDPNGERYERALAQWLGDYLEDHDGGAFVLFTSYRQLGNVHDLVRSRLERAKRFVLRQGDKMERRQMIDLFKSTGDAVLFGTTSFWEGVDVRGEALRHVIITKLPFEMPAHPLIEARHQEIKARGGNPFIERSVPEAILRLKQGVGRLIRTRDDTGNIVICDHRVLTKFYGRYFLKALPEIPVERFALDGDFR